jgi:hypothetical protein
MSRVSERTTTTAEAFLCECHSQPCLHLLRPRAKCLFARSYDRTCVRRKARVFPVPRKLHRTCIWLRPHPKGGHSSGGQKQSIYVFGLAAVLKHRAPRGIKERAPISNSGLLEALLSKGSEYARLRSTKSASNPGHCEECTGENLGSRRHFLEHDAVSFSRMSRLLDVSLSTRSQRPSMHLHGLVFLSHCHAWTRIEAVSQKAWRAPAAYPKA